MLKCCVYKDYMDFDDINSDMVTFLSDGMGLVTIDLKILALIKITLMMMILKLLFMLD